MAFGPDRKGGPSAKEDGQKEEEGGVGLRDGLGPEGGVWAV